MKQINAEKQFEVPIKGVITNTGKSYPEIGACTEIINLRPRGEAGEWEVVGEKEDDGNIFNLTTTNIYKHPIVPDVYFGYETTNHLIVRFNRLGQLPDEEFLHLSATEQFVSFAHLGNFFFVNTDKTVYRYIYSKDEESYSLLKNIKTPIVTASEYDHGVEAAITFYAQSDNPNDDFYITGVDSMIGLYYEHLANKKNLGFYEGGFLITSAYRLFDGTYIKNGNVSYCTLGFDSGNGGHHQTYYQVYDSGQGNYRFVLYFLATGNFKVEYEFNSQTDFNNLSSYEDLILSLDFFMTPIISWYDIDSSINVWKELKAPSISYPDILSNYVEALLRDSQFYKVHSIPFEDIAAYQGNIFIDKEKISGIEANEVLPVDSNSNHLMIGNNSIVYNGSLLYNNTTTYLGKGFDNHLQANRIWLDYLNRLSRLTFSQVPGYTTTHQYYQVVTIKVDGDEKTVVQQLNPYWFYHEDSDKRVMIFPMVLTYPDSRATNIKILHTIGGVGYYLAKYFRGDPSGGFWTLLGDADFDLTPHTYQNLAYYANELDDEEKYMQFIYIINDWYVGDFAFPVENNIIHNPNYIRASQVNNPLVFPAARTYSLGDSSTEVIATAVAREALGQGQYGQFPLYAFTNQGIYALEVGSGDILFSRVFPMNSEALINKDTIIPVNNSIFFATKEGYKFITGNQVQNISIKIRSGYDNKLSKDTDYLTFINRSISGTDKLPDIYKYTSSDDTSTFINYLEQAKAVYDSYEDEIILSNESFEYSWVYNIKTQTWYKISNVFSKVFYNYPGYLAVKKGETKIYDFSSEEIKDPETSDPIPILIQTEPVRITDTFFKINNLKLLCDLEIPEEENKLFGFYVFGSVDGKNYKFLNGKQLLTNYTNGVTFSRHSVSASLRYVIFLIAGEIMPNSRVKGLTGTFITKYQNKIR